MALTPLDIEHQRFRGAFRGYQREEVEQCGGSSVDVEMMEAEIEQIEAILARIAAERERMKVELRAGDRIVPIQIGEPGKYASVPTSPDP